MIPIVQKLYPYGDSDFKIKAITEKDINFLEYHFVHNFSDFSSDSFDWELIKIKQNKLYPTNIFMNENCESYTPGNSFSKKAISMKTEMTLPFKLETCYTIIFPLFNCFDECIEETFIQKISHEDFLEEYKNYPKEIISNYEKINIKNGKRSCYTGRLTFNYLKGLVYVKFQNKLVTSDMDGVTNL
jgi:uncharacterized protein YktA (UPF0223 family)